MLAARTRLRIVLAALLAALAGCVALYLHGEQQGAAYVGGIATTLTAALADLVRVAGRKDGGS